MSQRRSSGDGLSYLLEGDTRSTPRKMIDGASNLMNRLSAMVPSPNMRGSPSRAPIESDHPRVSYNLGDSPETHDEWEQQEYEDKYAKYKGNNMKYYGYKTLDILAGLFLCIKRENVKGNYRWNWMPLLSWPLFVWIGYCTFWFAYGRWASWAIQRSAYLDWAKYGQGDDVCPLVDDQVTTDLVGFAHEYFMDVMEKHPDVTVYPWSLSMLAALRQGGNAVFDGKNLSLVNHEMDFMISAPYRNERFVWGIQWGFTNFIRRKAAGYTAHFDFGKSHGNASASILTEDFAQMGWWQLTKSVAATLVKDYREQGKSWLALAMSVTFLRQLILMPIWTHFITVEFHDNRGPAIRPHATRKVMWSGTEWPFPENEMDFVEDFTYYGFRSNLKGLCDLHRDIPKFKWGVDGISMTGGNQDISNTCQDGLHSRGYYSLWHCGNPEAAAAEEAQNQAAAPPAENTTGQNNNDNNSNGNNNPNDNVNANYNNGNEAAAAGSAYQNNNNGGNDNSGGLASTPGSEDVNGGQQGSNQQYNNNQGNNQQQQYNNGNQAPNAGSVYNNNGNFQNGQPNNGDYNHYPNNQGNANNYNNGNQNYNNGQQQQGNYNNGQQNYNNNNNGQPNYNNNQGYNNGGNYPNNQGSSNNYNSNQGNQNYNNQQQGNYQQGQQNYNNGQPQGNQNYNNNQGNNNQQYDNNANQNYQNNNGANNNYNSQNQGGDNNQNNQNQGDTNNQNNQNNQPTGGYNANGVYDATLNQQVKNEGL